MSAYKKYLILLFLFLISAPGSTAQTYPTAEDLLEIHAAILAGDSFQLSQYLKKLRFEGAIEGDDYTAYYKKNMTLTRTDDGMLLFVIRNADAGDKAFYINQYSEIGTKIKGIPDRENFLTPYVVTAIGFEGQDLQVSLFPLGKDSPDEKRPASVNFLEIEVDDTKRTTLYLKKGERIHITADGRITYGLFAGSGGPNGISGFALYNIVKSYPHGCLLATIGENGAWHKVGYETTITADVDGYLKFFVNDLDPSNNSGSYKVKCRKL